MVILDDLQISIKTTPSGAKVVDKKTAKLDAQPTPVLTKVAFPEPEQLSNNAYMAKLFSKLQSDLSKGAGLGYPNVLCDISLAVRTDPTVVTMLTPTAIRMYFDAIQTFGSSQSELPSQVDMSLPADITETQQNIDNLLGDLDDDLPF